MITTDILEQVQHTETGFLIALKTRLPQDLYVGIIRTDIPHLSEAIPLGTHIIGYIGVSQTSFPKNTLSVKPIKPTVEGATPQKQLTLSVASSASPIKTINAAVANKTYLQSTIAITTHILAGSSFGSVVGYIYNSITYLSGEENQLFKVIMQSNNNYIKETESLWTSSNLLVPPFLHRVSLIVSNQPAKQYTNSIKVVSRNSAPANIQVLSLCHLLPDQKQNPEKALPALNTFLNQHIEKVKQRASLPPHEYQHVQIPLFARLCQKLPDYVTAKSSPKMLSPHMFLSNMLLMKHHRSFVKGHYAYRHYGDDDFNDKGWGCAYRALQSLLTWFQINGLLSHSASIPTIKQIQRALFDLDKSRNLVNTSEWIGANQVGWVVKKVIGIQCKIVFLSNGADVLEKAHLFQQHFETVGSPIMYGGDMYAYTIVGINYSLDLGHCLFLIMDPHFMGDSTNVKTVTTKGGFYWKEASELFKKGVYYNFCLPQLPLF